MDENKDVYDMHQAADDIYEKDYSEGDHCHQQSFKWGFQEGVEWKTEKLLEDVFDWVYENFSEDMREGDYDYGQIDVIGGFADRNEMAESLRNFIKKTCH